MDGTSSNRSSENLPFPFKTLWQLKLTAYLIVFGISLVGNTLVIAVLVNANFKHNSKDAHNRTKAASSYFLVNMAVADLIVTVFDIPVELITVLVRLKWFVSGMLGITLCKCYNFCWFQAVNVSTGSLSAIAVDRFLLVFYPYKKIITPRAAKVIIFVMWLTMTCFTLPIFEVYQIKIENSTRIGYPEIDSLHCIDVYVVFNFVAFVATPSSLTVMTILYTALSVKLWLNNTVVNQMHQSHQRDEKMNRRVTVMLIVIVLTFALCWLPFWVSTIYCYTSKSSAVCHGYRLHFFARFLGLSNSALNPCIYFSSSDSFRQGVKEFGEDFTAQFDAHRLKCLLRL